MNSKDQKEIRDAADNLIDALNDMDKGLGNVSDTIKKEAAKATDTNSDSFRNLGDMISKLKSMTTDIKPNDVVDDLTEDDFGINPEDINIDSVIDIPPVEGETCMHGNSWHSTCSECDYLDNIEGFMKYLGEMISETPNNMKLGKKVRSLYDEWVVYVNDVFPQDEEEATPESQDKPSYEEHEANNVIDPPEEDSQKNPDQLELF